MCALSDLVSRIRSEISLSPRRAHASGSHGKQHRCEANRALSQKWETLPPPFGLLGCLQNSALALGNENGVAKLAAACHSSSEFSPWAPTHSAVITVHVTWSLSHWRRALCLVGEINRAFTFKFGARAGLHSLPTITQGGRCPMYPTLSC